MRVLPFARCKALYILIDGKQAARGKTLAFYAFLEGFSFVERLFKCRFKIRLIYWDKERSFLSAKSFISLITSSSSVILTFFFNGFKPITL